MDTAAAARKNPCVLRPGESRWEIAQILQSAYAGGLLSEDTFVRRLDQVMQERLIDPLRIVGDISLRTSGRGLVARARAAMQTLVGRHGPVSHRWELLALDWSGAQPELLVGRHRTCDVVLGDLTVSRRHARLSFRDGRWILRDLASTNGTTVNGLRVGRCELRPGDRILLGDHHLLVD